MNARRIRIEPIDARACVRVDASEPELSGDTQSRVNNAWDALVAQNPRYFDAPILAYERHDHSTVHASVRPYKLHAVRETVETHVSLLSVTCLLRCNGADGETRMLLGLRGQSTHRYGGLWEFGPAGAMDAPRDELTQTHLELTHTDLIEQARRESLEEAGIDFDPSQAKLEAILFDDHVGSVDVIVGVDLGDAESMRVNWEYHAVRWASLPELVAWSQERPGTLIPPAVAIIEWLRSRSS